MLIDSIGSINEFFWGKILVVLILCVSFYLTIKNKFPQFRLIRSISFTQGNQKGQNPVLLMMASLGGAIGLGSLLWVTAAMINGGFWSLIWMWFGVFFGSVIKYSENYLTLKYRVYNGQWQGGGYFLLQSITKGYLRKILSFLFILSFGLYTIEIYQFSSIAIGLNGGIFYSIILAIFVVFFYAKNIKNLATITGFLLPVFFILYFVSFFFILKNVASFPSKLPMFSGIKAAAEGICLAFYTNDIGVGYDSIIQLEAGEVDPKKQASLSMAGMLINTLICSITAISVLFAIKAGYKAENEAQMINNLFDKFVPGGRWVFLSQVLLAGLTTVGAYFAAGKKFFQNFSNKWVNAYIFCGFIMFVSSCYIDIQTIRNIISICGGIVIAINTLVVFFLRDKIEF